VSFLLYDTPMPVTSKLIMPVQYNCKWNCAKCDYYHIFWVDSCDLKDLKFKCVSCKHINKVDYTIEGDKLICDVNPSTLNEMSVQEFVNLLPVKPSPQDIQQALNNPKFLEYGLSLEECLDIWSIHDALHYITRISFSISGEGYITFLEKELDIGWYAVSPELNTIPPKSFNFSSITKERVMEVAKEIRSCLFNQS
jgi:hypothetical protein